MVKEFIIKEILNFSEKNNLDYIWDKKSLEKLYVRIENNRVIISLDSSGDFLYKRNIKNKFSKAPIRENIAAALLLNYWNKDDILFDPMCGSATFSIEAAMVKNDIIPGINREFNFMNWINFKPKTFNYLKNNYTKDIDYKTHNIYPSDLSNESVINSNENLLMFKGIVAKNKDFFSLNPSKKSGFIVINLPYNKRIKVKKDFYERVEKKLLSDFKNWKYLILVSKNHEFNNLKKSKLRIKNGGILLDVYHGKL
jgi:putative N6-adenine-specific DNA methylase